MNIQGLAALVTGGGSGLGEATARELARLGGKVAVLDINLANAEKVADSIRAAHGSDAALACHCDITDSASMQAALDKAAAAHGPARILMNIAGIGSAKRIVAKDGSPAPLEDFVKVITINLN
jgi:NAD(P)-dependent dehydrogenase (short-subunit alcohol dehydrogenase family)